MDIERQQLSVPEFPPERFEFTGSGGEYFRIWIVNLLLTILTLGIYSAWAKVRRLQYFYRHTRVAGAVFDYHGDPLAILKGRLLALALLIVFNLGTAVPGLAALLALILLGLLLPWLLRNALRFRLRNSSYRGLRFAFHGRLPQAYGVFLFFGGLGIFTGVLWPLFVSRLKRYQQGEAAFGATRASFHADDGAYFGIYMRASLLVLAVLSLTVLAGFGLSEVEDLFPALPADGDEAAMIQAIGTLVGIGLAVMLVSSILLVGPYVAAHVRNLTWNSTRLGPHRFESSMQARRLMWISLSNFALIVLTLGLFMPWAAVRTARYRAQTLSLCPGTSIDAALANAEAEVTATGEETAEMFDLDIGL